jgi:diguanylate cyclase (GGDEF)-like protein
MILDVDHFKNYNDCNGHPAGDALLQHLAAVLESNLRTTDILCRYGGEEFAILLLDTELEEGNNTADKIREVISIQPFAHAEKQPQGCLSVSVGIAAHPFDGKNSKELIDRADQALYQSKARGRNCVTSWTEMSVA